MWRYELFKASTLLHLLAALLLFPLLYPTVFLKRWGFLVAICAKFLRRYPLGLEFQEKHVRRVSRQLIEEKQFSPLCSKIYPRNGELTPFYTSANIGTERSSGVSLRKN